MEYFAVVCSWMTSCRLGSLTVNRLTGPNVGTSLFSAGPVSRKFRPSERLAVQWPLNRAGCRPPGDRLDWTRPSRLCVQWRVGAGRIHLSALKQPPFEWCDVSRLSLWVGEGGESWVRYSAQSGLAQRPVFFFDRLTDSKQWTVLTALVLVFSKID
jgi:hypothetical protein